MSRYTAKKSYSGTIVKPMLRSFGTWRSVSQAIRRMSTTAPEIIKSSENPGPIELTIIDKLVTNLNPVFLKVANDSHKHAHHAGLRGATNVTESHFRIEVVSDAFEGKNMPSRHRVIYQLLDDEFKNKGLHALQMKTKTESEIAK